MPTILKGHVSPETAYVVDDYPYSFRRRCRIRYWLDCDPTKGARRVSQTTNPKAFGGEVWNKPKPSIYATIAGCMVLEDNGHVTWRALSEYCNAAEAASWVENYGEGVPEVLVKRLTTFVKLKAIYEAAQARLRAEAEATV